MNTLIVGIVAYHIRHLAILTARLFGFNYREELQRRLNHRLLEIEEEKKYYPDSRTSTNIDQAPQGLTAVGNLERIR